MRVIRRAGPPPDQPRDDMPEPLRWLTAWHPCDVCGTRSFEVWRHPRTWAIFTFCAHHGRAQQLALHALGFQLYMTAKAYA